MLIVAPDPLSLYCDASGNEREPLTVVGGVIASAQEWKDFEPKWRAVLKASKVEYFRASEFASSTGAFAKGWKKNQKRRDAFSWQLLQTIGSTVRWWCAIAILQSEYEKADRIYEVHENYQPFTIASVTCIELATKWREGSKLDYLPLKYFFESGDDHWGQMSDRIKERFGAPPIPGDKKDPPHQAADFVAYEARKAYVELEVNADKVWEKFRRSFLLWGQIPFVWGDVKEVGIRTEMAQRGIKNRTSS